MKSQFTTRRIYTRPGRIDTTFDDFICRHCGAFVSAGEMLSGVRNRNHCPYCLSSRHLDQFESGDRLSACKARMKPVGLTFKRITKKYAGHQHGELMLVHLCEGCGKVSINRIAADDDNIRILDILKTSNSLRELLVQEDIMLLDITHIDLVQKCLFGIGHTHS